MPGDGFGSVKTELVFEIPPLLEENRPIIQWKKCNEPEEITNEKRNENLKALGTLFWCLCYFDLIYRSIVDGVVGLPWYVIAYNISWEFCFSRTERKSVKPAQRYQFFLWFIIDLVLFMLCWIYGNKTPNEDIESTRRKLLLATLVATLAHECMINKNEVVTKYVSFGATTLYPIAICSQMAMRGNSLGVSMAFGALKMLGDGCWFVTITRFNMKPLFIFCTLANLALTMMPLVWYHSIQFL